MNRFGSFLSVVAACLFVLNVGVAASFAGASNGVIMTICSPDGTRNIVIDTDGVPTSHKPHCLKCFVTDATLAPPAPVRVHDLHAAPVVYKTATTTLRTAPVDLGFAARAPPLT